MATTLEELNGDNWQSFVQSPLAVLVLGKSDCQHCIEWSELLKAHLAENPNWFDGEVRIGKITLDTKGLTSFKRANQEWLKTLDVLPYNAIYQNGEKIKEFAGLGVDRLTNRLARILGE